MRYKKCWLAIVLLLQWSIGQSQQTKAIIGSWQGKLNIGPGLRIAMHIKEDSAGHYVTTLDSPDQSAYGLPSDTTVIIGDSVHIELRKLKASFSGRLLNDTVLAGHFFQGISMPLQLTKGVINAVVKPQTPRPPFPYRSEDIIYTSKDGLRKFGATITLPAGDGPFPAALLISGSGPQDRDEDIYGHKIFAVLADHLTKNGFIVLRVDDRGIRKSTGDFHLATSENFADDVMQGIDYLKSRKEVDQRRIGLIGHSEGGMIAPMVAAKSKDVNFIVLLAGPGVKISQLMSEQNSAILKSAGISDKAREIYAPFYKQLFSTIVNANDSVQAMKEIKSITAQWVQKTDTTVLKELGLDTEKNIAEMMQSLVRSFSTPWFKYFLRYDPTPYLQKLHVKVLALNGSKDLQVIPASNLTGIKKALAKSKSPHYDVKELPGLNHLFQNCKSCTLAEYGELQESFSPDALSIISNWLIKYVK